MARKKASSWKDAKHTIDQRRDAIASYLAEFGNGDTVDLLKKIVELRDEDARLDVLKQQISEKLEAISQTICDRWQAQGISSMDVDGIGSFSINTKLYVSAADKEKYFQWLKDNGLESLIQPQVAPKTTESLVRERLEEGQPCDEMGLNIHYKTSIR
jgi:hypothetical protein